MIVSAFEKNQTRKKTKRKRKRKRKKKTKVTRKKGMMMTTKIVATQCERAVILGG
jgi:hypothetical protein